MFHFSQITLKITIAPNFVILYTAEIKGCSKRTAEMRRTGAGAGGGGGREIPTRSISTGMGSISRPKF